MIDGMTAPKGFVVQRISNYGTSNENIARVLIQTTDLARFCSLSQVELDALFASAHDLAHRLASAQNAAADLSERSSRMFEELKAKHEANPDEAREIPFIPALQITFEGFFYNAKNIIRDLGDLMHLLYGKRFDEASDWCAFREGKESDVTTFFRQMEKKRPGYATVREIVERFRPDIQSIVRIRNAVEHPGKKAGTVQVLNWSSSKTGLNPPSYQFDGEEQYDLIGTLLQFHEMMLTLVETIIVFGLMFKFPHGIGLQAIAAKDRRPEMPVAYRAVMITPEMERQSQPFTGTAS